MKFLNALIAILAVANSAGAQAETMSQSKAIELSLHRIERLVALKRIDATFLTQLKGLNVKTLAHQTPEQPSYQVQALQVEGADHTQKTLQIIFDQDGHYLSHTVIAGTESASVPQWGDKDSVGMMETAMHWILDNPEHRADVSEFDKKATQVSLTPATSAAGVKLGYVDVVIAANQPTLRVRVKLDATLDGSEIIMPQPVLEPKFASIKSMVFLTRCTFCHNPQGVAKDVPLETIDDLVKSRRDLVIPGKPDESGLVIALSRAATDQRLMPPPGTFPKLADAEIAVIRAWILDGATK